HQRVNLTGQELKPAAVERLHSGKGFIDPFHRDQDRGHRDRSPLVWTRQIAQGLRRKFFIPITSSFSFLINDCTKYPAPYLPERGIAMLPLPLRHLKPMSMTLLAAAAVPKGRRKARARSRAPC